MRILFLTQWFQPENFFKGLPFAKALKEKGHDVEVLTGFPNYPGGKIFPGYRIRYYQKEVMDGITVHRVPLYPSHDKSTSRRIANYLSFFLSAFLMGVLLVKKPDVIYVYNLVTLGPAAFLLRLFYGSKVLIDIQDLWPESVANSAMLRNRVALSGLRAACDWVYKNADHLTVLSPGFKRALADRGIKPEKIDVIYNWCDETSLSADLVALEGEKPKNMEGKFVVLFAGAMGIAQGLDSLLDCANICKDALPFVQFVLIGGGVERPRLQKRAESMQLQNVTFLPPRSINEMAEVFAQADALLVHLKDDPLYQITVPSKTQAYLYIGKPIIMAMRGNASDLVSLADAGVICAPDRPMELMDAIQTLYHMPPEVRRKMGENGRTYYMKHLSFERGVDNFEELMLSV